MRINFRICSNRSLSTIDRVTGSLVIRNGRYYAHGYINRFRSCSGSPTFVFSSLIWTSSNAYSVHKKWVIENL